MIDIEAIRRAAELAHDERYEAAWRTLGRERRAVFFGDESQCIDCGLGGLTKEESEAVHAG